MTYYVIETAMAGVSVNQKRRGHVVGLHSSRKTAASHAQHRNSLRVANSAVYFLSIPAGKARAEYNLTA